MKRRIRTALALAAAWALLSPPSQADQLLYASNNTDNTVSQIDSAGNVSTFASGLDFPTGVAVDIAGNLYVATSGATGRDTILKFSATGAPLGTFASGLLFPRDLAFDESGNLYVTSGISILKFSATGTPLGTFASTPHGPFFLAFAPIPEPSALTLAGIGLAAVLGYARLRRGRATPAP
jgi:DNA-binding beta-propeller fold protein YncE